MAGGEGVVAGDDAAAGRPLEMNTAVLDRSSAIACAKPATCWPSAASRPTWP